MRKNPFTIIRKIAQSVLSGVVALSAVAFTVSCEDDVNDGGSVRSEYIKVYPNPYKDETSTSLTIGISDVMLTVYTKSNIDFSAEWQNSGTTQWASIINDNVEDAATGLRTVTVAVDPRSTSSSALYDKRSGVLILSAADPSLNYNEYIMCSQGSEQRLGTNFSWLSYGTTNPDSSGAALMDDWTSNEQAYNYSSTVIAGEEHAYCYGRNGYIQLGDDNGHGADLITPNTTAFYEDSLLMVSFRAVAYVDPDTGQRDNNQLTVEVTGGGAIQDYAASNGTSISFNVPYYNRAASNFPSNMWSDTNYLVFIKGTDASPLTANTHIRLISGSLTTKSSLNNRIFIDNLYIYTIGPDEEDYYTENGGSGLDFVLAE